MPIVNKLLSDALPEYLDHRRARGMRANTLRGDERILRQFLTQVGNIYLRNVTPRHMDLFFQAHGDWSVGTRNNAATVLRSFFRYSRRMRWMDRDSDPAADYGYRQPPQKENLRIPVQEFGSLLEAAKHPRNRMIIALGLFLFLRGSEVAALRIGDLDLVSSELIVTVVKAGDTQDVMMINTQLDRELRRYLTWYTERHGELKHDWFLIPAKNSTSSRGVDGRFVWDTDSPEVRLRPTRKILAPENVVQEVLLNLGYPTFRQGIHTLRRSGARAFYDELCDRQTDNSALEVVSAMLHHKTLVQTQHYLGVVESKKRRNRAVMEGPMFPSLEPSENVIQLVREAPHAPVR